LRWKAYERALHFSVAFLFIVLAITGLSLLFGRALLIPIVGKDAFAAYASLAKDVHNYLGPLFSVLLAVLIVLWMRHNIFKPEDWEWLKKWGGLFGDGAHPHAGRMNGGEKIWFWLISTVGVAACASGLIMDFTNFQQGRETMQIANIIHAVLSIGWIAVALGHIYIGTLGTEGALEGMTTGYVSEEWAEQHHDLWLEEMKQGGNESSSSSVAEEPVAEKN
jgi:formate dehydrogenase subunit gamma